ncbi:MAG: hypothetical protein IJ766_04530, partial [Clostridia bacterium]|nr:hypothetical protein [Clostridia bacterium]
MKRKFKVTMRTIALLLSVIMLMQILPLSVMAENFTEAEESLTDVNFDTQVEMSYIVGEDESKRDETTKHFRCGDGSYIAASYNYPVHYATADGWQELDFTLNKTKNADGETVYTTADGQNYDVSVPQDIFADALTYTYGDYAIGMTYLGQTETDAAYTEATTEEPVTGASRARRQAVKRPAAKSSAVQIKSGGTAKKAKLKPSKMSVEEYNQSVMTLGNASAALAYSIKGEDTTLDYAITSAGIKEDIVVDAPQDSYIYAFRLDVGTLTPEITAENEICLLNADGETVYTVEAPVMTDAAGAESGEIRLRLSQTDGDYRLEIEADSAWLNAAER